MGRANVDIKIDIASSSGIVRRQARKMRPFLAHFTKFRSRCRH